MKLKGAFLGLALMYTGCGVQPYTIQRNTPPPVIQETQDVSDGQVHEVTRDTFDEMVLQNPVPVVVNFSAAWCDSCRDMDVSYQRAAQTMSNRLAFMKYNYDSDRSIPREYLVEGIPTFIVFVGGDELCRFDGARANIQHDLERCLE